MRMESLRVGMKVRHASFGEGVVRAVSETGAEIDFGESRRTVSAADHDLHPGEPVINVSGLDSSLPGSVRA